MACIAFIDAREATIFAVFFVFAFMAFIAFVDARVALTFAVVFGSVVFVFAFMAFITVIDARGATIALIAMEEAPAETMLAAKSPRLEKSCTGCASFDFPCHCVGELARRISSLGGFAYG